MNNDTQTTSAWVYGGALLAVLLIAAGGTYLALSGFFSRGELGTKDYYATLQRVEFENRDNKDPNPIRRENVDDSGLDVLGVPGGDAPETRVWIVLNRTSPDGRFLIIPQDIPIKADCDSISRAISGEHVVDAVKQYLLKSCAHRP
ncbi:hypothetical protein [Dyella sp. ASV21]|uniref:hypothetical protein n=1 Tax=Dyella sp. ASV21 TaxID=2795114 RepID=UPI0018EA6EE5|nr:hypothetical protein [Dyella sp. ASV21]